MARDPYRAPSPAPAPTEERPPPTHDAWRVLGVLVLVTALVTAASYASPKGYAGTLVGAGFLGACYWLVLRRDDATIERFGLALGGLTQSRRLELRRLLGDGGKALAWALGACALTFPPFFFGYRLFWHVTGPFHFDLGPHALDEIAGQLFVVALPEEAFFRGYAQTALEEAWPRWRVRLFGARLGVGWLASAAIFAVGHFLTVPQPARLAVFFPALAFGWLRARTGGVGASFVFHALCNLFASLLARGYGLG